jgi:SPP1 gp7 family putative phage head morphogenesis protein
MTQTRKISNKVRQFLRKSDAGEFNDYTSQEIENSREFKAFRRKWEKVIQSQYLIFKDETVLEEIRVTLKKDIYDVVLSTVQKYFKGAQDYISTQYVEEFILFAATAGGQRMLDQLGISAVFNLRSLETIEALADRTKLLIRSVDKTTADNIAKMLSEGFDVGLTNPEISSTISEQIPEISRVRADMIAHAETANAMAQTELKTAQKNGIELKKWMSSRDGLVSPGCADNDDGVWYPLDHVFEGGDTPRTAPPRHPRCRCYMQYQLPEYIDTTTERIYWAGE